MPLLLSLLLIFFTFHTLIFHAILLLLIFRFFFFFATPPPPCHVFFMILMMLICCHSRAFFAPLIWLLRIRQFHFHFAATPLRYACHAAFFRHITHTSTPILSVTIRWCCYMPCYIAALFFMPRCWWCLCCCRLFLIMLMPYAAFRLRFATDYAGDFLFITLSFHTSLTFILFCFTTLHFAAD